ncbi:hypothetical protein SH2C18_17880 [Clostridium sediminicola]|uniref:hypothetical protein n=1 Tax=Clostridium sediminicola TaxID=3114879 RepID=UPI0031F23D0F
MNGKLTWGIILVAFGIIAILNNFGLMHGEYTLFIISGGFFIGYFSRPSTRIGLLIPACILLSIGFYTNIEHFAESTGIEGTLFFIFLGTGFLFIFFIHNIFTRKLTKEKTIKWPLITGIAIYAFSVLIFFGEKYDSNVAEMIINNIWPIALICVGGSMVINGIKKKE